MRPVAMKRICAGEAATEGAGVSACARGDANEEEGEAVRVCVRVCVCVHV